MSILSDFSDLLHTYDVQAIKLVPQDYGRPPEVEAITEVIPVSGQKQQSKSKIEAGLKVSVIYIKFYSGIDLDVRIDEDSTLRVSEPGGSQLGDFDVITRVEPGDEHVEIEAQKITTA